MGNRHRISIRQAYQSIHTGPWLVEYGGSQSDYIGGEKTSTSPIRCSPGDDGWEERLTAAVAQAKTRHLLHHEKERSGRRATKRVKRKAKKVVDQRATLSRLKRARDVALYFAALSATIGVVSNLFTQRWLVASMWLGASVMWTLVGMMNRRNDRLQEELHGHRGDAENDQGSAAEGTADGADEVTVAAASSGCTCSVCTGTGAVTISARSGLSIYSPEQLAEELEVYTAPVWGFREWNISAAGLPLLCSPQQGTPWTPGKNTASCNGEWEYRTTTSSSSMMSYAHEAPGDGCNCGFHACRDLFDARGYEGQLLGGVVGWGKVIDGVTGWRSEHAALAAVLERPVLFEDTVAGQPPYIMGSALQTRAEYIAELYNVPLCHSITELIEKTKEMADWMAGEDLNDAAG